MYQPAGTAPKILAMDATYPSQPPILRCQTCRAEHSIDSPIWVCPCGGLLDVETSAIFPVDSLAGRPASLWRYREALPLRRDTQPVSLGESMTPLLPVSAGGREVFLKIDHLLPTGSFKDRGAAVLLTKMRELGVTSGVEDSSGNAGAAIAAYAAAAGVPVSIYVPASAPEAKVSQIRLYGARLVSVPGSREDTTTAALAEAQQSYYASHVWNPFFLEGTKTAAFEIWEQLGRRAPDWVITPVGHGTMLLGLFNGFQQLLRAGVTASLPRIVGVQAANCAPLAAAWFSEASALPEVTRNSTIADGIAIARPPRWRQIVAAIAASRGEIAPVNDEAIWRAFHGWAARGIAVEPTAASALAFLDQWLAATGPRPDETIVVLLTGSALKTSTKILNRT